MNARSHPMRLFCLPWFLLLFTSSLAAEPADFAAVQAADNRRLAATIAGDTTTLSHYLSDELHYAHGDGRVQTKAQLIASVATNKIKYLSFIPQDVAFQPISDDAVAMNGRARLSAQAGEQRVEFTLRFLAVWRREGGQWRLLAYQSSPLAETAAPSR